MRKKQQSKNKRDKNIYTIDSTKNLTKQSNKRKHKTTTRNKSKFRKKVEKASIPTMKIFQFCQNETTKFCKTII